MAINAKGKRKVIVDEKVYWWFVTVDGYGTFAHIISDDKKFVASCHLESHKLRIGKKLPEIYELTVPMPYLYETFTPQYIKDLIKLVNN